MTARLARGCDPVGVSYSRAFSGREDTGSPLAAGLRKGSCVGNPRRAAMQNFVKPAPFGEPGRTSSPGHTLFGGPEPLGVESTAEPREGEPQARLYRAERYARLARDFAVREPVEECEAHELELLAR